MRAMRGVPGRRSAKAALSYTATIATAVEPLVVARSAAERAPTKGTPVLRPPRATACELSASNTSIADAAACQASSPSEPATAAPITLPLTWMTATNPSMPPDDTLVETASPIMTLAPADAPVTEPATMAASPDGVEGISVDTAAAGTTPSPSDDAHRPRPVRDSRPATMPTGAPLLATKSLPATRRALVDFDKPARTATEPVGSGASSTVMAM